MLTPHEEQEVLKSARDFSKLYVVLMGEPGHPENGSLTLLAKLTEVVISPNDLDMAHERRIRKLEEEGDNERHNREFDKQQRHKRATLIGVAWGVIVVVADMFVRLVFHV